MSDTKFDDFWRASELNPYNIADFARQMDAYDEVGTQTRLEYPSATGKLPRITTLLSRIARRRKSERTFGDKPLTMRQIANILGATRAHDGLDHRSHPAAGARYAVEVFQVLFHAKGFGNDILYYDPKTHAYVKLAVSAPTWKEAQANLNISVSGVPQSLVLLVMFPERVTAKYGERGGRFALYEVGAVMQQLALTIAESRVLKGVAVGGVIDSYWKRTLGLEATDARIALGYLVGR